MEKPLQKLSPRHQAALRAYALGRGVGRAAQEAGLSRWTVRRAKNSPAGQEYLQELRIKLDDAAVAHLDRSLWCSNRFTRDLMVRIAEAEARAHAREEIRARQASE